MTISDIRLPSNERRTDARRISHGRRHGEQSVSDEDFREMLRMLREQSERDFQLTRESREKLEGRVLELERSDQRIRGRLASFAAIITLLALVLSWAGPTRVFKVLYALVGVGP